MASLTSRSGYESSSFLRQYVHLGNSEAEKIAEQIKWNTRLKSLSLIGCKIKSTGFKHITDALETNTTLTSLNLYRNIFLGLSRYGENLSVSLGTTLQSLDLTETALNDSGVKKLATALADNVTLTVLKLGQNRIQDEGAISLLTVFETNITLTSLDISGNKISDELADRISLCADKNKRYHPTLFFHLFNLLADEL